MRRLSHRSGLVALVGSLALLAACSGGGGDDGDRVASERPAVDELGGLVPSVEGLTVAGERPTLSWTPVEGAAAYAVTVADEEGITWMWVGDATSVDYGTAPSLEDGEAEAVDEDLVLHASLDPAGAHRWFVTALDADGGVLAMSDEHPLPGRAS